MVDARSKPKSPAEIVNAPEMTQKQKIEVLDSWALDIERRLASTDDGMPGQGQDDGTIRPTKGDAHEERNAHFAKVIMKDTDTVWTDLFAKAGRDLIGVAVVLREEGEHAKLERPFLQLDVDGFRHVGASLRAQNLWQGIGWCKVAGIKP